MFEPTLNDILNMKVGFKTVDDDGLVTLTSLDTYGHWYTQLWHIDVFVQISLQNQKDFKRIIEPKLMPTIKMLLAKFPTNKVHIQARPTGWVFPNFLYMDTVPTLVYAENFNEEEKAELMELYDTQ